MDSLDVSSSPIWRWEVEVGRELKEAVQETMKAKHNRYETEEKMCGLG